ncbi:hypothetical protein PR202_ga22112 [Eleusine coracana subsp. coracana]|uniref:Uncharacterized protein n=1 Tax=Eleusine coracana subsp. coracana TaxID=191504 RepID=A0AAV5D384_ELECO|nr:hypothetical protein PR202_ga22112 [Eleusine coracana subsp. coracana]
MPLRGRAAGGLRSVQQTDSRRRREPPPERDVRRSEVALLDMDFPLLRCCETGHTNVRLVITCIKAVGESLLIIVMEYNREETLRARRIALRRLENKDFRGAQRIALIAQRLYSELEHLSQLLTVCEVHCAAEVEISGDLDWYGILQVKATADDLVIRKQYEASS